ncbi:terminase large subunit domain-containing protein [Actinomadura nitritigenes]|uniref:terminase large subunit domain-containing protein n=1 Tax=Actinomadura nitritigenes TaxID=134602 RepID=UPI003D92E53E
MTGLDCPPRWGTPRNFDRPTLGPRVAKVAEMLGSPLMPWQRHVADVALEVDPATGRLVYREVVLTVPRQSGKTLLLLCMMVHRAQGFGMRQRILYAAQTRNDARKKWEEEHVATLEASALKPLFDVRRSNGSEAIRWRNGSTHGITAATEKSGHGETLDLGVIDEAFAHEDARLEQGMRPTMITRPQPQIWVVSTAGTARSNFLRGKVDMGRNRVDAGVTNASTAYFEWSAPKEADPEDPATWRGCMPALGHTVTEEAVRAELEGMELSDFRRAYLNQWPDDIPDGWQVIGKADWDPLEDAESQIVSRVAFGIAASWDRSWSAIAVAGLRADGLMHVEVMDHRPGTDWLVNRFAKPGDGLVDRWDPCAIVVHPNGPAGSTIADFKKAGVELLEPSTMELAHATGQLYDRIVRPADADPEKWKPSLRYMPSPVLNAAVAGARKRMVGDQWAFDRRVPGVDISPLEAAVLAAYGFTLQGHVTEEVVEPWIAYV